MTRQLLCVSDIHNDFERYAESVLPDADAVLIAGDFTNRGDRDFEEMVRVRTWMHSMASRYACIYFVCGNHDFGLTNETFDSRAYPPGYGEVTGIERRHAECLGLALYGASLSTCFDAPQLAQHWCRMTGSRSIDSAEWDGVAYADILLSHSPPEGVRDAGGGIFDRRIGRWTYESLGSPGLLRYLKKHRPRVVVCGHIHEASGITQISYLSTEKQGAGEVIIATGTDRATLSADYPHLLGSTLVVNCAQLPVLVTIQEQEIIAEILTPSAR